VPDPKSQKQQIIVLGVLAVFGFYMLLKNYYFPLTGKIEAKEKELEEKETKLAYTKQRIANLKRLEQEYGLLSMELERIAKKLPKDTELPALIRIITDTGRKFGIDVDNLTPKKSVTRTNYIEHQFEITLETNYHNLAAFFTELAQQERVITFSDLEMTYRVPTQEDPSGISVQFYLIVYTAKL